MRISFLVISSISSSSATKINCSWLFKFERNERAVGVSIRNFRMVWPIGQPTGPLFERAMLSRSIWKEICNEAGYLA